MTITNQSNVTYNYVLPDGQIIPASLASNIVTTEVLANGLTNVKSVDKAYAVQGDTLHYTSVITNTGALPNNTFVFTDPIPTGTTFTAGSVKVNGVSYPVYNPQIGFVLPDLAVGQSVTVEFDVTVN